MWTAYIQILNTVNEIPIAESAYNLASLNHFEKTQSFNNNYVFASFLFLLNSFAMQQS